ncbi:MAG: hypothetical protein NTX53_18060 [candidate division WOR-3 bacterium]|nr:hypothetical protein [candidate division WOR-3 bacterium]
MHHELMEMPGMRQFFYQLMSRRRKGRRDFLNFLGLTHEKLEQVIRTAWGFGNRSTPDVWKHINVEEVFTWLDVGEHMWAKRTIAHRNFEGSKRALVDLIWHLLALRTEGQHCERLLLLFHSLRPKDSVVSFNWDPVADHTLEFVGKDQYTNYMQLMTDPKVPASQYLKRGVLLKLHGSINWVICKSRSCRAGRRPYVVRKPDGLLMDHQMGLYKCPVCGGSKIRPYIVPPASNKAISDDRFLRSLWMLALNKLYDVGHLVFVGYSLPVTDSHAEWLFRHVHLHPIRRPTITVADPEIMDPNSALSIRFRSVFRGLKLRRYASLEDLASDSHAISPRRSGRRFRTAKSVEARYTHFR